MSTNHGTWLLECRECKVRRLHHSGMNSRLHCEHCNSLAFGLMREIKYLTYKEVIAYEAGQQELGL